MLRTVPATIVGLTLTFVLALSGTDVSQAGSCPGDLNDNGEVDLLDLNTVLFYFGVSCPIEVTHVPIYTFNGDSAGDLFGVSVDGAVDVNNDGFDDLIVGAWQYNTGSGVARVFSGVNGAILYTFNGDGAGDNFGYSVSSAGDVNNDGFDDLIVGAPYDGNNGKYSGSARVLSGVNGAILYTFDGDGTYDRLGFSGRGAGDVNNDGFDDLIVGALWDDNNGTDSGSARVFSGLDGSTLYTFNGDGASDNFGYSVSGAGDVDDDGFDDFIVGAYLDDNNGSESGSARVFRSEPLSPCPGDTDGDSTVNLADLNTVLFNFGLTCP